MNNFQRIVDIIEEDYQGKPQRVIDEIAKEKELKELLANQLRDAADTIAQFKRPINGFQIDPNGVVTLDYTINTFTPTETITFTHPTQGTPYYTVYALGQSNPIEFSSNSSTWTITGLDANGNPITETITSNEEQPL